MNIIGVSVDRNFSAEFSSINLVVNYPGKQFDPYKVLEAIRKQDVYKGWLWSLKE